MSKKDSTTKPELLPCPFCGDSARVYVLKDGDTDTAMWVCCDVCEASGPEVPLGTEQEIIDAWNRRA